MNRRGFNHLITAAGVALTAPSTFAGSHFVDNDPDLVLHVIYETRLIDLADVPEGNLWPRFPQAKR